MLSAVPVRHKSTLRNPVHLGYVVAGYLSRNSRAIFMTKPYLWLYVVILLIGFALFAHRLDDYPPAVSNDEAVNSIDAVHLARTGNFPMYEEHNGRVEPLYRIFLAWGTPWGYTVWGQRLAGVFMNLLNIAAVGWTVRQALRDLDTDARHIAAAVAMIALVSMLTYMTVSRSLYRANAGFVMLSLSIGFVLAGLHGGRWRDFVLGGAFGGVAFYTYTAMLVYPLGFAGLGLTLILFHRAQWRVWVRGMVLVAVTAAIVISPILYLAATYPRALFGRAEIVSGEQQSIDRQRQIQQVIGQFYAVGDENPQYNVALAPILNQLWLPVFVLGLVALVMRLRTYAALFLLLLLIVFILPVLLAEEATHALRVSSVYVIVPVIIGVGAGSVVAWAQVLSKRRLTRPIALGIAGGLVLVLAQQSISNWRIYQAYWDDPTQWKQWDIHGVTLDHNEWFFRTDRRALGAWISAQDTPLLVPTDELRTPTTRLWLFEDYPRVVTADESATLPPDTRLLVSWALERGDYRTATRDYALLHDGTITLLPPLSQATHADLLRLLDTGERVRDPDAVVRDQLGITAPLPADFDLQFAPITVAHADPLATYDDEISIMRWYGADTLQAGQRQLPITLMWRSERRLIGHEYAAFVQILTQEYQRVAGTEALINRWLYPSTIWQTGDLVPDTHDLDVPPDLPVGAYRLGVGVYYATYPPLPATSALASDLPDIATIGWLKVPQRTPITVPTSARTIGAVVGENIALDAGDLMRGDDGNWYMTLYWRSLIDRPPVDGTIFVHLVDETGTIVAQNDSRPWNGQYPTFIWDAGERVATVHPLADGAYSIDDVTLRVGMYTLPDVQNLAARRDHADQPNGVIALGAARDWLTTTTDE